MPDLAPVRRALISVSDKSGLVDLGRALSGRGIEILSTGGSAATLRNAGIPAVEVSDFTGFPEMMDGRVKTLHPKVHGGILAVRDDPEHRNALASMGGGGIDLVVVNLYPFEQTVARGASFEDTIEQIDIGGPAMVRSASKNHAYVTVIVDPDDYDTLLSELEENQGATSESFRRRMAAKAFGRTAAYDAAISRWFAGELGQVFPDRLSVAGTRRQALRYGENPHQVAAFYVGGEERFGVATARQVQGKELSYNNLNDTDAAYELVSEFDAHEGAAVAIIKHANPCGVAVGRDLRQAYEKALACDPVSAFGGIIAVNRRLDAQAAEEMVKIFTEVIIAPEADDDAVAIVGAKKNLRLLLAGGLPDPAAPGVLVRSVAGGFLAQSRDTGRVSGQSLRVVTKRAPTDEEMQDLLFAFTVCKHVKSNTIVYAKGGATVGIGAGQMSRVDSARIAALKALDAAKAAGMAEPATRGSAAASDAFFPFPDGLLAVAEAGATAVIQPGGSMRDSEVIEAADNAGLAMVFTGIRHFRH
jgi:phosphoribosylaminoimidazolecarboxamide formyltransferase/IMP cyclohydrolase